MSSKKILGWALVLLVLVSCSHRTRVVVVPFENFTRDPKDDWLRDGFSESLNDHLLYIKGISLFHREEINKTCQDLKISPYLSLDDVSLAYDLAGKLEAERIVIGSFHREGNDLVLFTRILDVPNRSVMHPLRHRLEGPANYRFFQHVQTVAEHFLPAMNISSLTQKNAIEKMQVANVRTHTLKAFEYFILARLASFQNTEEDYRVSSTWYREAIKTDFRYSLAYAGLAETLTRWGFLRRQNGLTYQEYYRKAQENIALSRKYDLELPSFHFESTEKYLAADVSFLIGETHLRNQNFQQALAAYQQSLEIVPRDAFTLLRMGEAYAAMGRKPEARASLEAALQVNPSFSLASEKLGSLSE